MATLLGIEALTKDPKTLPKFRVPSYYVAKEGMFLRNQNLLGEYFVKQKYIPAHVESMGSWEKGYFNYTAPRVPKEIVGKIVDFFRRVFEKDKTEAEVLLLYKAETKEFDILVPWQINTGVSVNSLYDPGDVPDGFVIVGSFHSHCDFGAFHSGTDTADASTFNGLHVTIGHVNQADPSWAVMVMINEQEFTFKDEEDVLELEHDIDEFTAPEEWFDYLKDYVHEIVAQDFKTLTKQQLDAFEADYKRSTYSPPKSTQGKTALPSAEDYDDWWFKSTGNQKQNEKKVNDWRGASGYGYGGYGNGNYVATRFNEQFRKSFPTTMVNALGEIKEEFIGEVLVDALEKLRDIAEEYDIKIEYSLKAEDKVFETPENKVIYLPNSGVSTDDRKWGDPITDDDIEVERHIMEDISEFTGEEGFFRAINKIMEEEQDQEVIDRRIAALINMED